MKTYLLLAALVAAPLSALASPESDRIAVLEARLAALESALAGRHGPAPSPRVTPAPRPSRSAVAAVGQVAAWKHPFFAAIGVPMLGYPGYSGGGGSAFTGGTVPNATTFSDDVTFSGGTGAIGLSAGETIVPADGTLNVTGAFAASSNVTADGSVITPDIRINDTNVRIRELAGNDMSLYADAAVVMTLSSLGVLIPATAAFANTPGALTIADNGGGTAAAHTALPTGGRIRVTCNDADTCEWTITETSAVDGFCASIVNDGTQSLVMKHAAGQVLFPGGADQTLGGNDEVTVCYDSTLSAWLGTAAVNR